MIINLDDERRKRLEEEAKRNGRTPEEQLSVMQDLFAALGFPEFDAKPQPQATVEQIVEMMMREVRPVIDNAPGNLWGADRLFCWVHAQWSRANGGQGSGLRQGGCSNCKRGWSSWGPT